MHLNTVFFLLIFSKIHLETLNAFHFWLVLFSSSNILFLFAFIIHSQVLEDQYNPRLIKELLQDLITTLYSLTIHVGRCALVGNINIWMCRLETILKWQQQLNDMQIPKVEDVFLFV